MSWRTQEVCNFLPLVLANIVVSFEGICRFRKFACANHGFSESISIFQEYLFVSYPYQHQVRVFHLPTWNLVAKLVHCKLDTPKHLRVTRSFGFGFVHMSVVCKNRVHIFTLGHRLEIISCDSHDYTAKCAALDLKNTQLHVFVVTDQGDFWHGDKKWSNVEAICAPSPLIATPTNVIDLLDERKWGIPNVIAFASHRENSEVTGEANRVDPIFAINMHGRVSLFSSSRDLVESWSCFVERPRDIAIATNGDVFVCDRDGAITMLSL